MATYSRLVVDANRMRGHDQFIRRTVEGWQLTFNRGLEDEEIQRRVDLYHEPYHKAVDAQLRQRLEKDGDVILLSVHSFTPAYFGELRHMDIGVLYQPYEAVALRLAGELKVEGFNVALNEPYSASDGLTYSADRHGENHKVVYLELEINQLLIDTPAKARVLARRVADALMRMQVRSKTRDSETR
jgi:predicted N-formylglutamate amidohydrolase